MNRWLLFCICLIALSARLSSQAELDFIAVATGFSSPVSITHAGDGTNRLFIVERNGLIKIIDNIATGSVLPVPFLDITGSVESGGEKGLLGLSFHPDYPDTPYFFVNYTFRESGQLKTKVERYTVSADPNLADVLSALQILEVDQPYSNHNAGDIKFGPDKYLYVTMGDGGSGEDPDNNGQDTSSFLGSLLRIDISGDDFPADPDFNYKIPPGNPFIGFPGYREEIWAIGLRNPWRISFDRMTGDLWIGDVGQSSREEVNFQASGSGGGQNYGWSCKEGSLFMNFNPCIPGVLSDPVFEYPRSEGQSITGGYVYRGSVFPNLSGYYVVADYGSGNFWIMNSSDFNDVSQFSFIPGVSTFGESESGELYVAHLGSGVIYRIVDKTICDAFLSISVHNDTIYAADSLILSTAPVEIGPEIEYFSPNIVLDPSFLVENSASFKAMTLSCIQKLIMEQF